MDLSIKRTTISGEVNILDSEQKRYISVGATIDATKVKENSEGRKILEVGTRLGQITSSEKYAPVKSTELSADAGSTDTTISVVDATYFQSGDGIDVGDTTATIDTVDEVANTITLTAQLGAAASTGDSVTVTDGSETAVFVLYPHDVDCTDGDIAVGGIDEARLIEDRVPGTVSDKEKTDLAQVTFV